MKAMTNKVIVEAVVPVSWLKFPIKENWEPIVEEILSLDGRISARSQNGKEYPIHIRRLDTPKNHEDFYNIVKPKAYKGNYIEYFVFYQNIEYEETNAINLYNKDSDITNHNTFYLYECTEVELLVKNVVDILLSVNIAIPGGANALKIYSFIKSNYYRSFIREEKSYYTSYSGVGYSMIREFIDTNAEFQWPTLHKIKILDFYLWIKKIDGFDYGVAKSKLGIAYAAFSNLMSDGGSRGPLIWSLMALEALYCKGNVGLRQQLTEKTEIFLGKRNTHKKKFGAMYDYRSRFLHGDINLVFYHHIYDASSENERFENEFYDAEAMALSTLIATFQKMHIDNIYDLKFSYKLDI